MDKHRRLSFAADSTPASPQQNDSKINQSLTNIANNSVISGGVKVFSSFVTNPFGISTPPKEKEGKKVTRLIDNA
jgi:hypothetical protein